MIKFCNLCIPEDFYIKIHRLLKKTSSIIINQNILSNELTKQCTPDEFKFALAVENVLNTIHSPEYRQMIVESLVVFCAISESVNLQWNNAINFDKILLDSNKIFCDDQLQLGATDKFLEVCEGTKLSQHFVDSAPSGQFGSMTYISRAIAGILSF